ncbi:MAG: nucleotidyltransferase family protein [Candidatus Micrarchaeia archaeon]|jgi:NDP-sugar pyrophosphorylase family protein
MELMMLSGDSVSGSFHRQLSIVNSKPLLEWQFDWLHANKVDHLVLLTSKAAKEVVSLASKLGKERGIRVDFSLEDKPRGTAGAILLAERYISDKAFAAMNGDIVTNLMLSKMSLGNSVAAIALVPLRATYGVVKLRGNQVIGFQEKPMLKEYWINGGVYLFSNEIFDMLPKRGDLESTTFVELSWKGLLKGIKFGSVYWRSIESPKDIEVLSRELKRIKLLHAR